jgi:hypothetical protein
MEKVISGLLAAAARGLRVQLRSSLSRFLIAGSAGFR